MTTGQSNCYLWHKERKWRLTASKFADIALATERRDSQKLCQTIFDTVDLRTDAIIHGRTHESTALERFSAFTGLTTRPAGLFIHPEFNFLAATPDALVGSDFVVEVKCSYKGRNSKIESGDPFDCLEQVSPSCFQLKRTNRWFYQIQGQMACAQKPHCFFVLYTFVDLHVEKISYDPLFFNNKMLPKLRSFYENHWVLFLSKKITSPYGPVVHHLMEPLEITIDVS